MVLALRSGLAPALMVPDELSLTMWGYDSAALGVEPTATPGRAGRLLLPEPLPGPLTAAVAQLREQLPVGAVEDTVPVPLSAGHEPPPEAAGVSDPHDHSEHDHGDAMAITGEPSADGLVMEPIEFEYGPLATGLPGGLLLAVELDGDVVSECRVQATLSAEEGQLLDPLAPATSSALSAEQGWLGLAAVELERALSHVAWLRSMGRLLGWLPLVERSQTAVTALLAAEPRAASRAVKQVLELVEGSSALAMRLSGRGCVRGTEAAELHGTNARAGGAVRDARDSHPLYADLGFEPVIEAEGDALARTRVRACEVAHALELALRMSERQAGSARLPQALEGSSVALEGPRGPLVRTNHDVLPLTAPGGAAALVQAGRAAVGLEWAAALATVASFDLSPWRLPE